MNTHNLSKTQPAQAKENRFLHTKISRALSYSAAMLPLIGVVPATLSAALEPEYTLNGIDNITVVGTIRNIDDVAGSITFISPEELKLQNHSDINRVLRAVPGLNIQEEDGYGLRPNIGIRGSGSDRSSKVLIMEDGVLMAPAPYAAPAAYYFPMIGRMHAIEVTKGPATVRYGPNTTAGAIQLFSTPIPKDEKENIHGYANVMASDLGRVKAHAWVGDRVNLGTVDLGFMLETYQDHADGFKDIAVGETGFDIEDYVMKLGAYSRDGRHSLEFKFQYKDEVSHETYLGLSQADFDITPNLRYNASQLDNLVSNHKTYQLTHNIDFGQNWSLTNIAYRTEFARNWRKLDKFDNSQLSGLADCNSPAEILDDPILCALEFEALVGAQNYISPDDVLQLRANNRTYYAQGIQSALRGIFKAGTIEHDVIISARIHEDQVSRFQDQDGYRIDNTNLVLTTDNAPGTQANRLSKAKALSIYAQDSFTFNDLKITAGLRMENVKARQDRWDTPNRSLDPTSSRRNDYTQYLPALSAKYDVTNNLAVLGGIHKGFSAAPVSSRESTDPEKSMVYEGGLRYRSAKGLKLDAILFYNDYSNLLGACTNSSGSSAGVGGCDIGDAFNAGRVSVHGLELTSSIDLADIFMTTISFPLSLSYSYTQSELKTSFSNSFWGNVTAGDELPYVPKNQLTLTTGIEAEKWGIHTVLNLTSKMRNSAGQGPIDANQIIGGRTLVDFSTYYKLDDNITLQLKAENIFDEIYIAARRPYGLRPGKPREIFAGIAVDF